MTAVSQMQQTELSELSTKFVNKQKKLTDNVQSAKDILAL